MKAVLAVLAIVGLVAAQDVSGVAGSSTCSGNRYSSSQIEDAAQQALQLWGNYQTVGNDKYPHKYNDYEGFSFSCDGPYLEFPIQESGVYTGGSPGADRVIIGSASDDGSSGEYCHLITHNGASGNNFVECSA